MRPPIFEPQVHTLFHPGIASPGTDGVIVVVIGGSEGGIDSANRYAMAIGQRGISALALGYFRLEGLPDSLSNIPLEYFDRAIDWVQSHKALGDSRIVLMGVSRGAEPAILSALHRPNNVAGVIAVVPSNVVLSGWPQREGAAWTREGTPLPFSRTFGPLSADSRTFLPIEKVRAPVMLIGAGQDKTWPSDLMAIALEQRLVAANHQYGHLLVRYPQFGHNLMGLGRVVHAKSSQQWPATNLGTNRCEHALDLWSQMSKFIAHYVLRCRIP